MKVLVTLTGASGSGKSTVEKICVLKYGLKRAISHTSRNPRQGEVDGKDYFFTTKEIMHDMYNDKKLIEYTNYNDNYYGVSYDEALNSDILVVEPKGLEQIKKRFENTDTTVYSIYLDISSDEQIKRMKARGDKYTDIYKRIKSDKKLFVPNRDLYNIIIPTKSDNDFNYRLAYLIYSFINYNKNMGVFK